MSQAEIVSKDILIQFLEVAFNTVLYFRKIYPDEIFVRKKIYGCAVHVTIHPELNEYLSNILTAVKELVTEDEKSVKSVNLTIVTSEKVPVEKYVFDIIDLQQANASEKDPYFLKTEEALRTICLKLSMCQTYLKPLPQNSTFFIDIITYETAHIALNENAKCENFPWIINDTEDEIRNKTLLPIKTVKTEHLTLQMYVLENTDTKTNN